MRNIIIFWFLLSAAAPGYSQRFTGGISAGVTGSQVDGDKFSGFHKLGIAFGPFTRTRLNNFMEAKLELRYSGRGAWGNSGTKENPRIYQLLLNYVELPVTIEVFFSDKYFIEGGISPSFLLSRKVFDGGGRIPDDKIQPDFNSSDYNYLIGLTYLITPKTGFNIRYQYSILPIRRRNIGNYYYGWLADVLGYREGDYNNFITLSVYFLLS